MARLLEIPDMTREKIYQNYTEKKNSKRQTKPNKWKTKKGGKKKNVKW